MKELQVLVATMHQTDQTITERMNIRCDAVIANQAHEESVTRWPVDGGMAEMITTCTRGVGINRNIALLAADADILLFADDDMVYYDGTLEGVKEAFRSKPEADVIIFSVDIMRGGEITERRYLNGDRLHLWNALKYGTYAIGVRRDAVRRANIFFTLLFGGGARYGAGEDSLFIRDCFRKGLRVWSSKYVLGTCCKDTSSWFVGYNDKFFFDKGALYGCAFPRMKRLVSGYFALKYARKTQVPVGKIYRLMLDGMCAFQKGKSFAA